MKRRHPQAMPSSLLICSVLMLALLVPSAQADEPDRTVLGPSQPSTFPAGMGCAFPVHEQPSADARRMITVFDDGRTVTIANGNPTLTNLATGATFAHRARYHATLRQEPATNEISIVINGEVISRMRPGDQGPWGLVSAPGLLLRFSGIVHIRRDRATLRNTSFEYEGHVTDVCAALS